MRIAQLSIAAGMILTLFPGSGLAQQDAPVPTFSAGTRLVEVDVVARSKGATATGLTKEDFTLFDNGKPQKIAFFSVRSARPSGPATRAAPPLPAGAVSNRLQRDGEALGNATVVFIDQKNTLQENQAFAIQRIVKFVRTRRRKDRIGIYTFWRDGVQAVQELTDDAGLLSRAASRLTPRNPGFSLFDSSAAVIPPGRAAKEAKELELRNRAMDTKHILAAIARHLASVPGRKNLIWVTASFPLIWPSPYGPECIANPSPDGCQPDVDFRPDMEEAAHALSDANVALYAVDARGLVGALSGATAILNADQPGAQSPRQLAQQMHGGTGPSGIDTMSQLADLTGGLVFYQTNGIEDSIQAAVDDGALTYTLGFYPVQESQDGSRHNLKVEVARPGVSVRYRESYFASKTPAVNERPTLEELLRNPLDATQLELLAETEPDPARPGFRQVRVTVDLHGVQLERENDTWVGAVNVSFFVEGAKSARTITRRIEIRDRQLAPALGKGIAVSDSIAVNGPAGKLRIVRIVAQDPATGAAGSVRVPLGQR